eukprot:6418935-Alexandrium_andersonii.AAC.1
MITSGCSPRSHAPDHCGRPCGPSSDGSSNSRNTGSPISVLSNTQHKQRECGTSFATGFAAPDL